MCSKGDGRMGVPDSKPRGGGRHELFALLMVCCWGIAACGGGIVVLDGCTDNWIIGYRARLQLKDLKQTIISELNEIDAVPDADVLITGFEQTGKITPKAAKSLTALDASSKDRIKELLLSYALASSSSKLRVSRRAVWWGRGALLAILAATPGFFVGWRRLRGCA